MMQQPLRAGIILTALVGVGYANAADLVDVRRQPQINQQVENAQSLRAAFGLSQEGDFEIATADIDQRGGSHVRYRQTFRGVPVWGEAIAISRDSLGRVQNVRGRLVRDLAGDLTNTIPTLTGDGALDAMKALAQSRREIAAARTYENESAELVIYLDGQSPRLAFAVSFFSDVVGGGDPSRPTFIVDAHTGEVIFEYEGLTHADGTGPGGNLKTGPYEYGTDFGYLDVAESGSSCTMDNTNVKTVDLNHGTIGSTAFSYGCFRNTHKTINGANSPLNDAHYFGGVVFDMYSDWMATAPLPFQLMMRVHYGNNYENAFWNGSSMTFGDGYTMFYPLVGLDVASHEVSHGFTERTSGLIYSGQSGGINEAYSDIAGEAAEYYSRGGSIDPPIWPDWLVGAEIFKVEGEALRYMANPPDDGVSIGHASDYYEGMDVHYSSGVYNKAFYLLATSAGWDVYNAFVLFATANQYFWYPSETFDTAYQGLLDAYEYLTVTDPEGPYGPPPPHAPNFPASALDDIEIAFAAVGVPAPPPGPVCGPNPLPLTNGVPTSTFSGTAGEWQCWTIDVSAGATDLSFRLRNRVNGRNKNGGDADLYVRYASSPAVDPNPPAGSEPVGEYDCGGFTPDSNELCEFPGAVSAGTWYVAVYAWSSFASVDLTSSFTESLGNSPPSVSISTPSNGASFGSGESISFAGLASDDEDGDLAASLAWTSDLDGSVGSGGSFSAMLSDGTHVITAEVTDSGSSTGTDSITVIVGGGSGGDISLSVNGYKIRGNKQADLTWSGATSGSVDVYRDGTVVATTLNDGAYTDGPFGKGGGSTSFQVCEAGTSACSDLTTVNW